MTPQDWEPAKQSTRSPAIYSPLNREAVTKKRREARRTPRRSAKFDAVTNLGGRGESPTGTILWMVSAVGQTEPPCFRTVDFIMTQT